MELPEKYQIIVNELGKEKEVKEYTDWIASQKDVELNGGYLCYWDTNEEIARTIPKDKIVIDVGCSFGLQHLLFKDHKMYIGIQRFREGTNCRNNFKPRYRTFTDNAIILEAEFKDFAPMLWQFMSGREDEFFGISNSSLWNDEKRNEDDIRWFKQMFPKNYWVTKITTKVNYDPPTTFIEGTM
jgi:hypothetical protein